MNNLAELHREQGEWAKAETLYLGALELLDASQNAPGEIRPVVANNLSTLRFEQRRCPEALLWASRA